MGDSGPPGPSGPPGTNGDSGKKGEEGMSGPQVLLIKTFIRRNCSKSRRFFREFFWNYVKQSEIKVQIFRVHPAVPDVPAHRATPAEMVNSSSKRDHRDSPELTDLLDLKVWFLIISSQTYIKWKLRICSGFEFFTQVCVDFQVTKDLLATMAPPRLVVVDLLVTLEPLDLTASQDQRETKDLRVSQTQYCTVIFFSVILFWILVKLSS